MNETKNTQGLTLFQAAGLIDPAVDTLINNILVARATKNKAGDVVGFRAKSLKPDEVRKELGLPATKEGREQAAVELRKRQDNVWNAVKLELLRNGDLTLVGVDQRTKANGVKGTTIRLIEADRPNDPKSLAAKLEKITGRKVIFGDEIKPTVDVKPSEPAQLPAATDQPELSGVDDLKADEAAIMAQLEKEAAEVATA